MQSKIVQIYSNIFRKYKLHFKCSCSIRSIFTKYFGIFPHSAICNEMCTHVRKRIFCESKYMRLGNVYGLTQWMSFGRVEVHFFFRSEIFCLFSLVLLNFFLSQCFNIDLCSRVVKCMWNKWNAHTWKRISFIFVYLEQSVCQNWRKFLVFLFLFISAC